MTILKASNIHKHYYSPKKVKILNGLNLEVKLGETVAIMGRSGEGKSTLLQILGTLDSPCEGTLEIANQTVSSFNKTHIRNQSLSFIFQSFHLLEDYTSLENVLMPARIARKNYSEKYGMELLDLVGMSHRAHFNTKLLSGGEKQRIAIARAFCNNPDLILADEPSGNLDRQTAEEIHSLLIDYVRTRNKAMIIVTHDQQLASLCQKTYILHRGQLE